MASGRTHDIVNLSFLPVAVYYLKPQDFLGFTAGYLVGTFLLSPDLDLRNSKPARRWKLFKLFWYPYTKIFKHRGVSHIPILGSIIRLFYVSFLMVFPLVVYLFINNPAKLDDIRYDVLDKTIFWLKNPFIISFFIGIVLSEIVHVITDMIYSTMKKLRILR